MSPQLDTHPDDANRVSATFLSEGTRAAGAASSPDGGATWTRAPLSAASRCSGGSSKYAYLVNPQFAAGPSGSAYFGNSWLNGLEEPLFEYGVAVHGSHESPGDPPRAWSAGSSPGRGDYAQNVAVVPDADTPGAVLAVWTHIDQLPLPNVVGRYAYATSELLAAQSTDGAHSFGAPVVAAAEPGQMIVNVRAEQTSDGGILVVYDAIPVTAWADASNLVFRHRAVRSNDGGVTWSRPVDAGDRRLLLLEDPDGRSWPRAQRGVPVGSVKYHLAAGPDGRAAIVWAERLQNGGTGVRIVTSRDDGRTWTPAATAFERPGVFQPAVAYDANGTLGVVFYDWSRDALGDEALSTDVWLATSRDEATSWRIRHLDGPFDLRATYESGVSYDGWAIGVYQDLVGFDKGFGAAYTVGPPLATDGRTDVWFARAGA